MVRWTQVICPHPSIASRVIGDQALILDPKTDALQRLNPVGSFIWQRVSSRKATPEDIAVEVVQEFDVEPEQARLDIEIFLQKLEAAGLVAYKGN